jgi:hypothetical protein
VSGYCDGTLPIVPWLFTAGSWPGWDLEDLLQCYSSSKAASQFKVIVFVFTPWGLGLVKWDLWWTKRHCGRFSLSRFPLRIFIQPNFPSSQSPTCCRYNRPESGDVPSGPSMDSPHDANLKFNSSCTVNGFRRTCVMMLGILSQTILLKVTYYCLQMLCNQSYFSVVSSVKSFLLPFFETICTSIEETNGCPWAVIFEAVNDKTLGCKNSGNGVLCMFPCGWFLCYDVLGHLLVVHYKLRVRKESCPYYYFLKKNCEYKKKPRQCPCSLILLTPDAYLRHLVTNFCTIRLIVEPSVDIIVFFPNLHMITIAWEIMLVPSVDTTVQDAATWGAFGVGT